MQGTGIGWGGILGATIFKLTHLITLQFLQLSFQPCLPSTTHQTPQLHLRCLNHLKLLERSSGDSHRRTKRIIASASSRIPQAPETWFINSPKIFSIFQSFAIHVAMGFADGIQSHKRQLFRWFLPSLGLVDIPCQMFNKHIIESWAMRSRCLRKKKRLMIVDYNCIRSIIQSFIKPTKSRKFSRHDQNFLYSRCGVKESAKRRGMIDNIWSCHLLQNVFFIASMCSLLIQLRSDSLLLNVPARLHCSWNAKRLIVPQHQHVLQSQLGASRSMLNDPKSSSIWMSSATRIV